MDIIAERIKSKREQKNMTQDEVAKIMGISRVSYTLYETGKNKPSLKNLIKLADIFETSIDYLVGRY